MPGYNDIEYIAQYNRNNGTNFYTMSQVNEHRRSQSRAGSSPTDIGDDVYSAYLQARQPKSIADMQDVKQFENDAATTNKLGLIVASLPFAGQAIASDLATYGLLGGGARLIGGAAGSTIGSTALGTAGDWADNKLGTNFIGNTGRFIGGLSGWGAGARAAYHASKPVAGILVGKYNAPEWLVSNKARYDAANWALNRLEKQESKYNVVNENDNLLNSRSVQQPETQLLLTASKTPRATSLFTAPTIRINSNLAPLKESINKELINRALTTGQLHFGGPTIFKGYHQSNSPTTRFTFPFDRWDVRTHGADPNGAFMTLGNPATAGFLSERPYTSIFEVSSQKPLYQEGELSNFFGKNNIRNELVKYARENGADAVVFNDIADNQLKHQNILFATDDAGIKSRGLLSKLTDLEMHGLPRHERNLYQSDVHTHFLDPRVVDREGNIDYDLLARTYKQVLEGLGNRKLHSINESYNSSGELSSLKKHVSGVVKTAQTIPVPKGSSRAELVRTALVHDIGKLITGQESLYNPKHPTLGLSMIRKLNLKEFDTPFIRSAVKYHMDDSHLGQYNKTGIERLEGLLPGELEPINWDLLRALQASDVSRGLPYDLAAARYPQLFTYAKENPVQVKFADGDQAWQLKHVVNPILKREGYPTVKLSGDIAEQLNNVRQRHRSFFRGVRDPQKAFDANADSERNAENAALQAIRLYGDDNAHNRMIVSLETIPLAPTGSGRADLFETHSYNQFTGLPEHKPGWLSRRLKVSPATQDALYLSGSTDILKSFSDIGKSRSSEGMAAKVTIPFDPIKSGESLPEFMERTDFQLYNGQKIRDGASPMSYWQKYEVPYRLQTGRSLQSDMLEEYLRTNKFPFKQKSTTQFIDPSDSKLSVLYELSGKEAPSGLSDTDSAIFDLWGEPIPTQTPAPDDMKSGLKEAFAKHNINFNPLYEREGKVAYNPAGVRFLKDINDYINHGLNSDLVFVLGREGILSKKIMDLYPKIGSKEINKAWKLRDEADRLEIQMRNKQNLSPYPLLGPFAPTQTAGTYNQLPFEGEIEDKTAEIKRLRNEADRLNAKSTELQKQFVAKYVFNKNILYKIKEKYYDLVGVRKRETDKDFLKYIHNEENIINFLRARGIAPLWEMPNFGRYQIFSTNGGTWGSKPSTRNVKILNSNNPQGIIIGDKGQHVLEVTKILTPDEFKESLRKIKGEGRDVGHRMEGEGLLEITRKTFKQGGKIKSIF